MPHAVRPISAHEHEKATVLGISHYVAVWIALVLLAILSFGLSRLHLPGAWPLVIALAIATIKGGLVLLFFMHMWVHRGASRLTMAVAFSFLLLLLSLTIADMKTRFPIALPPGARDAREHLSAEPPRPWSGIQRLEPRDQPHFRE